MWPDLCFLRWAKSTFMPNLQILKFLNISLFKKITKGRQIRHLWLLLVYDLLVYNLWTRSRRFFSNLMILPLERISKMGNRCPVLSGSVAACVPLLWKCLLGWLSSLGSEELRVLKDSCAEGPSDLALGIESGSVSTALTTSLGFLQAGSDRWWPTGCKVSPLPRGLLLFSSITQIPRRQCAQVPASQRRVLSGLSVLTKAGQTVRCWVIEDEQILTFLKWEDRLPTYRLINWTSHE